jgi:hypothetical protein
VHADELGEHFDNPTPIGGCRRRARSGEYHMNRDLLHGYPGRPALSFHSPHSSTGEQRGVHHPDNWLHR